MTITAGSNSQILSSKTFKRLPLFDIDFELHAKCFKQEGDLKYEYNAFRNLRLANGELTDFRSSKLNFNLNSPVDITVQPSYDDTVNLILNDDRNPPRLINSRFTPKEDSTYVIVDRKGNNDTNIYDEEFVTQNTRLFRTTEKIPYVTFDALYEGGNLKTGNYVFYFKYSDADGNESDIIAESGIVSCYVGKVNDPASTRGGLANELTNKIAKLYINNLDLSYDYLNIYYTRSTGDYNEIELTQAYKINTKTILSGNSMLLTITGYDEVTEIPVEQLNIQYNVVDKVKTQTQVQNMLFFGNVDKPTIPYKELEDLALRVYPTVSNDNNIGYLDHEYKPLELQDELRKTEYYDAVNVYKYTGYWNKEMYRVGMVFILKDDSLSPVMPVRGKDGVGLFNRVASFNSDIASHYTYKPLYDNNGNRQYIDYDELGFIPQSQYNLENTKGVIRITYEDDVINKDSSTGLYPLAIDFNIGSDVMTEIKKVAKGFFFVRQKRLPTILAQGLTIGVDSVSYTPSIFAQVGSGGTNSKAFISESFIDKSNQLVNDFNSRLLRSNTNVTVGGLLCPEAQLRSEYFNEIFTGALFNISQAPFTPSNDAFVQDVQNNRHFYIDNYTNNGATDYLFSDVKLTNIEDSKPARYNGTKSFSSRAGIPEEAWKFAWFDNEDRNRYATNLLRGNFTGFTGLEGYNNKTSLVDIHIPGYNLGNLRDYFLLRFNSTQSFFAISDRYDLELLGNAVIPYDSVTKTADSSKCTAYRGDCFFTNYTVRMIRNFVDPETPINDLITDTLSWKNNYTGYNASGGLNNDDIRKINRADINAVRIGHWATFKLCSNINLAYRAIDESNSSEYALTGMYRSFYPLSQMSVRSENKAPDSNVVNVGYSSTTSDKMYFTAPDVPAIKNIFDNRIMFSDVHINDAFKNNYRVFQGLGYKDISRQYGAIVKMFEWRGDLLVVFEHGVGVVVINERAIGGTGAGGDIYIKGAGVLSENIMPLSTDFGSSWRDSIIRTTTHIYGVDTVGKKIWRTDGKSFEILSDFKVQEFLNQNITLSERDKTPMIALRNVKTHYNANKGDVMFTFYDETRNNDEVEWNLCFNDKLNKWITRYSWTPVSSASIDNVYFSFDKDSAKNMSLIGYSLANSSMSEGIVISDVNINAKTAQTVGTLSLKKYDYYSKYDWKFTLMPNQLDNSRFNITGNQLKWNGINLPDPWPKFAYRLKIQVQLLFKGTQDVAETWADFIIAKVNRASLSIADKALYDLEFSTWFWKHGKAGLFDISGVIEPTKWYDKQEQFEYEFVALDNPATHKIFNNLYIISNNVEPDSFEFEVIGDSYELKNITETVTVNPAGTQRTTLKDGTILTYQKGMDLKKFGRLKGNMQYLEDHWNVEIKPQRFTQDTKIKEARIRDKFCKIRVRYSGTELAIITALETLFTQSYA